MPPIKGKRGPKKGAKTKKVTEEKVEKTGDKVDVKSDNKHLEEVQVDMELQMEEELPTDVKDNEQQKYKDVDEDKMVKNDINEEETLRVDEHDKDKVDMETKKQEKLEVDLDNTNENMMNMDSHMDNYNIDLDVEGSSPEMLVNSESEPVYEQEMVQDFTLEELNQNLKEITDSLLTLSKELELLEDEEEEGAIKEDEVPFDRFPDVLEPSTVLLLLNLPPELDNDKTVKVFTNHTGLVNNASFVNKTQMRVHFTTQKAATAAKNTLDNLKLYNRKLQVLYSREYVSGHLPSHMNFPYNISPNEFPERNFNKYQNVRNNYNDFNVPPPPTVGYTGPPQDRYKVVFNRYKLANNTLYKVLMEFYEELNTETGRERLRWDEKRPFYENLLRFDKMYEKTKVSTRYLLLGNMSETFLEDTNLMHDFLARYTNTTYTYEYVMLPSNYPEKKNEVVDNTNREDKDLDEVEMDNNKDKPKEQKEYDKAKKKWLLLVFDKNRDASVFYNKFMNSIKFFKEKISNGGDEKEDPDGLSGMVVKYSCPLHALDTLWIGNVTDLCAYFVGEDEFYSFFSSLGTVKYFKLVYESSCMFVTFQDVTTSTKVYNFLNSMSPKRLVRLYNLRNKNRINLTEKDDSNSNNNSNTSNKNSKDNENNMVLDDKDNKEDKYKVETEMDKELPTVVNDNLELEDFLDVEKADDLLNVDFSVGKADNSYILGQKLLNAIKRRSDSKELIENLLNTKEYSHFNRDQEYMLPRNGRQYRREYPEVWRRERGRFDRRYREPYSRDGYGRDNYNSRGDNYGRDSYSRDQREGPYSRPREDNRYMNEGYNRGEYVRNRDENRMREDNYGRDGSYSRESRLRDDSRGGDREYNRFRQRYPINKENRVDKFGRTIRPYDRSRRDDPWKSGKYSTTNENRKEYTRVDNKEMDNQLVDSRPREDNYGRDGYGMREEGFNTDNRELDNEYRPPPPNNDMDMGDNELDIKEPPLDNVEYCKLLKRGKYICTVNAKFIRGDNTCRLPELLDVNQRANPERLKNCLSKSNELSLWKLAADSKEDNLKYESLCEYLISKNRLALVQEGPFDVYIVPPHQQFEQLLNTPDSKYMYAYLLPRAP